MARSSILATSLLAAEPAIACTITAIEGAPVHLRVAGAWQPAAVGPLPEGAGLITTGSAARAEMVCTGDLVVTVGVASEIALAPLVATQSETVTIVSLLRGILGLDAAPDRQGRVEVRTPLAIASSRSTAWFVEHDDGSGTAVFVRSGRVAVSGQGLPPVELDPGEGITLESAPPQLARILRAPSAGSVREAPPAARPSPPRSDPGAHPSAPQVTPPQVTLRLRGQSAGGVGGAPPAARPSPPRSDPGAPPATRPPAASFKLAEGPPRPVRWGSGRIAEAGAALGFDWRLVAREFEFPTR